MTDAVAVAKPKYTRPDLRNKVDRRAYGVAELAAMIGVSRGLIYREAKLGKIEVRKLCGRSLIMKDEAERFIATIK